MTRKMSVNMALAATKARGTVEARTTSASKGSTTYVIGRSGQKYSRLYNVYSYWL
jgi:hypothetical protein